MAQNRAIIDKLLTNVSSALVPEGYVSEVALPTIRCSQQTGKLGKYGQAHLRIENTLVGGEGKYRRVKSITRSTTSYTIDGHGLEGLVTESDYRNVELPYKAESDEVIGLSTKLWLEKESALATTLSDTSVMTQNTTLSSTAQFSDYANSDPLAKFKTARSSVRAGCGLPPDTAIMDWGVADCLAYHPQILDALGFKQNRAGSLNYEELARALGVQRILVARPVYNSAKEGQTDVLANVWGKHIIFAVLPLQAQVYQTSLGYMVRYENKQPRQVYKYDPQNPPNSTAILCEDQYDMLISNAGAGYLIKDAIA